MADRVRKIAVLLPSLQVGGAERVVLEELAFLKNDSRFSFEVHLVFEKGPFYDSLAELDLPMHVWGAPHRSLRMLKSYGAIIRHLRRTGCELLHCHLLNDLGPLAGKLAGVKVVTSVHSDALFSLAERFSMGRSDLVFGCGTQVMRNIRAFVPAMKARQLNNSIRLPETLATNRTALCKKFRLDEHARIVLSLGRLIPEKGYDVLIEAFRSVVRQAPEAVLLIAGDGAERQALQERIDAAQMQGHIRLLGMVRDVDALYGLCDVYVNSSRVEGLPMTILEAMAHRRAIVATEVGGNPEVVRDRGTGLLVKPEDPEKLSNAISTLLLDATMRDRLGAEAYALFAGEYTIEKHCETLAGYYMQVLQ